MAIELQTRLPRRGSGAAARRQVLTGVAPAGAGVVASAPAAACATGGGGAPSGGTPAKLKSGVTLLMVQYGTQPEGEAKQQVLDLSGQKYPGLKTQLDNTPGGGNVVNEKEQAMTVAGTPPDLFWFGPALFLQCARRQRRRMTR